MLITDTNPYRHLTVASISCVLIHLHMITSTYSVLHDDSMWAPKASRQSRKKQLVINTVANKGHMSIDSGVGCADSQSGDY